MIYSIHFSGLGGQGVLTLTKLFAEYTRAEGFKTTLFNSKGMAQRGGRVTSDLRISSDTDAEAASRGTGGFEARIGDGNADMAVGLEIGEAINSLPIVKPEGTALLYTRRSIPAQVVLDRHAVYPEVADARDLFSHRCSKVLTATETEGPANIYILGILGAILPWAGSFLRIEPKKLEITLRKNLKRNIETNIETLQKGYEYGQELIRIL